MTRFNITNDIYFKMIEIVEKGDSNWDCIELEDGCALTFAVKDKVPHHVEVFNEDDVILTHDFSLSRYNQLSR